mmetsp:Transcript_268/g.702  ORF Transcript_268/g.702 Transcript_268/m.702 type:complete len:268 (-) Transcript_268:70-873(-)
MVMKDIGTCCLFLPLKMGVSVISMLVFANSIVCILALITGDIRFQATGYNQHFYRVPSVVGAFGLVVGFFGILGAYEDKHKWVHLLNRFLVVKILADVVTRIADLQTLDQCDSFAESAASRSSQGYGHLGVNFVDSNPALRSLADAHLCPYARWAYLLGACLDTLFWCYFFHRCWQYEMHLAQPIRYNIDFGVENATGEDRWRAYQVKPPSAKRRPPPKADDEQDQNYEQEPMAPGDFGTYGSTAGRAPGESQAPIQTLAPDGMGHP